jgi:ribonuclease P protein component
VGCASPRRAPVGDASSVCASLSYASARLCIRRQRAPEPCASGNALAGCTIQTARAGLLRVRVRAPGCAPQSKRLAHCGLAHCGLAQLWEPIWGSPISGRAWLGPRTAFNTGHNPLTCDCAAPARLTLPAQRRLRRKSDFDAAYAGGRRFGNGFFGVTAFGNDKGWPRLGLAVAVRTAGGGVERNRIRRIIRESFRLHQHELPSVDLIISARGRAKDAPGPELHASLVALWTKVKEQCTTLPRS